MEISDVQSIVIAWLKEHDYDGLCCDDCGCSLDALMGCWCDGIPGCVPAYYHACKQGDCEDCEATCPGWTEDWAYYTTEKNKRTLKEAEKSREEGEDNEKEQGT